MGKHITGAYLKIDNVPDTEAQQILDNIKTGLMYLERVYKRNYNPREFNIDKLWQYTFENKTLVLDMTKEARKYAAMLEYDLGCVFRCAKSCCTKNIDMCREILTAGFCCAYRKCYSLRITEHNKIRWLLNGFFITKTNPFEDPGTDDPDY